MDRGRLHAAWGRLLAGRYTDPDNARLARLLRKYRDSVLRLLDHDGVDGTNLLAEREVRTAVMVRKLSAGNRTEAGAKTHAVLMSVLRTLARQGRSGRWWRYCSVAPVTSWRSTTPLRPEDCSRHHPTHSHRVAHCDPVTRYQNHI